MADLRAYNFKKPKELRQIIGQLLDENRRLSDENRRLREQVTELSPKLSDDDISYLYQWVCPNPECSELNKGEFFSGGESLVGEVLTCEYCDREVEVTEYPYGTAK